MYLHEQYASYGLPSIPFRLLYSDDSVTTGSYNRLNHDHFVFGQH